MSFNSSIPLVTDTMLQSQSQIKANFQAINQVFSENHVDLTSTKSSGAHNLLLFTEQTSSPNPTTSSSQIGLYTQAVNSIAELFFVPSSSGTPIQMTYPSIQTGVQTPGPPIVYYPQQYSFMAGPFIIYGGKLASVSNGQTITLTPGSTLLYVGLVIEPVNVSPLVPQSAVPTSLSGTSFNVSYPTTLTIKPNVWYFAIGM